MSFKLLAVSDLHADEQARERIVEMLSSNQFAGLILAGDITNEGPLSFAEELVSSAQLLGVNVFAVPGNMDPPSVQKYLESGGASIHNRKKRLQGGWSIAGFGGVPSSGRGLTLFTEDEIYHSLAGLKIDKKTILVTHSPPHGVAGFDRVPSGLNVGSPAIRKIVEEFKPAALVCGHIHENEGVQKFGETLIVKVGAGNAGRAAQLEISGDTLRASFAHL